MVEAFLCMRKTQPFRDSASAEGVPGERRKRHNSADLTRAANGQPTGRRGRKARSPEPSSPAQDERQTRVFNLHVEGFSVREIAKSLGIARGTAQMDLRMEGRRRTAERAQEREAAVAESVGRYEQLIFRATQRLAEINSARETSKGAHSAAREAHECDRLVLEAQARIDLVLGLLATPTS